MPSEPLVFYYLSNAECPVPENSPIWTDCLPLSREVWQTDPVKGKEGCFSYGDYFSAAKTFIRQNDYQALKTAICRRTKRNIETDQIRTIHIYLEKHGEFYHPSRIEVSDCWNKHVFVLNMAVSEKGMATIKTEFRNLERLAKEMPYSYLPDVYSDGMVRLKQNREVGLFLGQWFSGFQEFHLAYNKADGKQIICIWGETDERKILTENQCLDLYVQAAKILTLYYDVSTFKHILSWHHAAGDFVVRLKNDHAELKLISVRDYTFLFRQNGRQERSTHQNARDILYCLLIFLLILLIRMRLDREDGIGPIIWADDVAVYGALHGFLEALEEKPDMAQLPDTVSACFRSFLLSCSMKDLLYLNRQIVEKMFGRAPEFPVVQMHLKDHVAVLFNTLHKMV